MRLPHKKNSIWVYIDPGFGPRTDDFVVKEVRQKAASRASIFPRSLTVLAFSIPILVELEDICSPPQEDFLLSHIWS